MTAQIISFPSTERHWDNMQDYIKHWLKVYGFPATNRAVYKVIMISSYIADPKVAKEVVFRNLGEDHVKKLLENLNFKALVTQVANEWYR